MNAEYSDPSLVINFTQLSVNGPNGMHFVNHFHWVDWPDRGVPPPDLSVVQLLEDVQQLVVPAVVHCSAGIGRTGSLVMVSNVLELFRCGLPFDSSGEILRKIREQRAASIQVGFFVFRASTNVLRLLTRNCFPFFSERSAVSVRAPRGAGVLLAQGPAQRSVLPGLPAAVEDVHE